MKGLFSRNRAKNHNVIKHYFAAFMHWSLKRFIQMKIENILNFMIEYLVEWMKNEKIE